ncbi:hypothetical protein [Gillisia sp. Hel_I_86]|uniref:hypothetical protein n=1 Tax=Gillisia sp. Hel_I_86 TaxID=1249981 RepID=UPI0011A1D94D|nr:hypothetical protein [Gillisia sp. Hel_I_86]
MKIEHLEERIADYKKSIKTVVDKKVYWTERAKPLLHKTLKGITARYELGWRVQELNWIHNNEAINISFDSFPKDLIDCTNQIPAFQFIPGGALVFSQTYSGDVFIFILFPEIDLLPTENNIIEMGLFNPIDINEKFLIEKVDEFLKEMINWELPNKPRKLGFNQSA